MTAPAPLSRFLGAGYAYAFLFDFCFAYAIYTALFSLKGLTVTEIGILIAFWSAAAIVLELPSGALSDWFDRRVLLAIAPLVKALTFVVWAIADGNFWLYGLGFLFWSIGQALYSGTIEAVLYERLDHEGRATDYAAVYGRVSAAESMGIGTGLLFGGFVAAQSMELSVWLSVPPMFLCAISAIWLTDVRRNGEAEDDEPGYLENFAIAWSEIKRSPDLRRIALYITFGLILFEVLEEFDQLYYLAVSLPIWLFGVAGAVGLALTALGSVVAHRLEHIRALPWLLPALGGGLLVLASFGDNPLYVVVLEAAYIIVVPATVLAHARFQHILEGRSRATATSALEVAQNVTGIAVTLAFGVLAEFIGVLPAYGWAGFIMLPVAIWAWAMQPSGRSLFSSGQNDR
jgi:MFS family permease